MNLRLRLCVMMFIIVFWGIETRAESAADNMATRAEQLLQEGNAKAAIGVYEELITKFPTYESIWPAKYNLGYAYYMTAQYDKAVEMFRNIAKEKNVDADLKEQCAMLIANNS